MAAWPGSLSTGNGKRSFVLMAVPSGAPSTLARTRAPSFELPVAKRIAGELGVAVRAPVAAVEEQQDRAAPELIGQPDRATALIGQREVGCLLGFDLGRHPSCLRPWASHRRWFVDAGP